MWIRYVYVWDFGVDFVIQFIFLKLMYLTGQFCRVAPLVTLSVNIFSQEPLIVNSCMTACHLLSNTSMNFLPP